MNKDHLHRDGAAPQITSALSAWFGEKAGICVCQVPVDGTLFPEEKALVASAVPARRAEFAAGRTCIREALAQIGVAPQPIGTGPLYQPLWPDGIIGSLSHDHGLCAAAVLPEGVWAGIGLDLVHRERSLAAAELSLVLSGEERTQWQNHFPDLPAVLLFSMKESVVKAISAAVGRFIDLPDIRLNLTPEAATFTARHPGIPQVVSGWWVRAGGFWLTAAVLPGEG